MLYVFSVGEWNG